MEREIGFYWIFTLPIAANKDGGYTVAYWDGNHFSIGSGLVLKYFIFEIDEMQILRVGK